MYFNYTAADLGYDSTNLADSGSELALDNDDDPDHDPSIHDHQTAVDAQTADGWEPQRPVQNRFEEDVEMEDAQPDSAPPVREKRKIAEGRFHEAPCVVKFPSAHAGEAISDERSASSEEDYEATLGKSDNIYAPFVSKMDWDIA
ncbi:hypothetical protein K438DRAFT_1965377 [Mycena galopus ATCC 62051]|nr:hypothetical protein K438DRAFT_1965377 [Mycena galopus ATCC 62051]